MTQEQQVPSMDAPVPGPMPDDPFGVPFDTGDFDVDLTDVEDSGFIVPPGDYLARLVGLEKDISSNGNEMFVWKWQLVEGQYAGKEFSNWTALSPQALWKVAETTKAIGVGSAKKVSFRRDDVMNKLAILTMKDDMYEGRKTSKIATVKAPPQGAGAVYAAAAP